jgi:hypothetical protein
LRWLFPLSLREDLLQSLSFDCQPRSRGLGQFLCELQQVLSHDYKNTPTGTVLKSFGAGRINNLQFQKLILGSRGRSGRQQGPRAGMEAAAEEGQRVTASNFTHVLYFLEREGEKGRARLQAVPIGATTDPGFSR